MNDRRPRLDWLVLVFLVVLSGRAVAADRPTGWTDRAPAEILAELSLAEKAGQLFIVYHGPPGFMAEHGFGGSLIFQSMLKKPDELRTSLGEAQARCRIPLLVAIDQEGGKVNRLQPWPGFAQTPSAADMAAMEPGQLVAAVRPWAAVMADLGINTNLAPVVDPARGPDGQLTLMGRRDRAFGDSAAEIVPFAGAFIHTFAEQQIACIVKHFPGYNVAANSDHELAVSTATPEQLAYQARAFQGVMRGALGVMMSSIRFTAVSESPAVLDSVWVDRARCGRADRLVMTDDLWGSALRAWISGTTTVHATEYPRDDLRRLVLLAFTAGNDMLMVTFPRKAVEMKAVLVEEIAGDPALEKRLDAAVLRILQVKSDLGLFSR